MLRKFFEGTYIVDYAFKVTSNIFHNISWIYVDYYTDY